MDGQEESTTLEKKKERKHGRLAVVHVVDIIIDQFLVLRAWANDERTEGRGSVEYNMK